MQISLFPFSIFRSLHCDQFLLHTKFNGRCTAPRQPAGDRINVTTARSSPASKPPKAIAGVGWWHIKFRASSGRTTYQQPLLCISFLLCASHSIRPPDDILPSMTSTIGIPIKLLNEAQVRFFPSSSNLVLSITATASVWRTRACNLRGEMAAPNRISLAGPYYYSRNHVWTDLPRQASRRYGDSFALFYKITNGAHTADGDILLTIYSLS